MIKSDLIKSEIGCRRVIKYIEYNISNKFLLKLFFRVIIYKIKNWLFPLTENNHQLGAICFPQI